MIKLCPCLSHFPSFLGVLKVWLFFRKLGGGEGTNPGDKPYTRAVKHDILVNV